MSMLFIIFLFLLIVAIGFAVSGEGGELKLNKTTYKNIHHMLASANFENFVKKYTFDMRLIFISGVDYSGRKHLANMISKKSKYTIIDGKDKKPQNVRRELRIDDSSSALIQAGKKNKFIVTGDFSDDDLKLIFKGKSYNRNFLFLFVAPQPDYALRWSQATEQERATYPYLIKKSESLLKTYKKYRIYCVKNDFSN